MIGVSEKFKQEVVDCYGYEAAQAVLEQHAQWQSIANDTLISDQPEHRLAASVSTTPYSTVERGSYGKAQGIKLVLPRVLTDDFFERIPNFWIHEVSHAARQQAADKDGWDNDSWIILNLVIDEGVASYTELSLLGACIIDIRSHEEIHNKYATRIQRLLPELVNGEPIKKRGKLTLAAVKDYMSGTSKFENRGHVIGHYIVSSIAERHNLPLDDVITLPTEAYRELAKKELLAGDE